MEMLNSTILINHKIEFPPKKVDLYHGIIIYCVTL